MTFRLPTFLATLGIAVTAFAMSPAFAAPAAPTGIKAAVEQTSTVTQVHDRRGDRRHWDNGRHRGRHWNRGRHQPPRWGWRAGPRYNCLRTVRTWTPWGYQWRRVNVCR